MTKQIPQGYKQTKLGIIPEDWDVVKLNEIVKNVIRDVKKPDVGYWRLGLRSHGKGTFHEYIEYPKKIAMETLYTVNENDLIINITFAWEHAIAIANKNDHGKLVSHRFPTYQFINNNHLFYKYYMLQEKFRLMLENISPGGAGRNRVMSKKSFLELIIIRPSREEQDEIVKILSTWDSAIDKQEQLIKQNKAFKKGLMQQIFSQKLRFKDDNCNDYPPWQFKKFNDCLFSISLKNNQILSSEINQVGKYPVIDQGQQFIVGYSDIEKSYKDYPVIIYGDHTTLVKYVYFDFIVGGDGTKTLKALEKYNLKFMYYVLQIFNVPQDGYKRHFSILKSISFIIPQCLTEQAKIADFFTSIDDEITKRTETLDQLKLQKQSLMQKLLTGHVRVFNSNKEFA